MKRLIVSAILLMAASAANAEDILYVNTAVSNDNLVHMTVFKSVDRNTKGAVYVDRGYYGIEEARIAVDRKDAVKMATAFARAAAKMESRER
jgi:hypothetical protein